MYLLRKSQFLTLAVLVNLLSACSMVPESAQDMSASAPLLSSEQRDELLDMLKSHKDNEALIQQWRESQAGVTRLLTIESELSVLIDQLNELGADEKFAEAQTSKSNQGPAKPLVPQSAKEDILETHSGTQNHEASQPTYKASLGDDTKLSGLIAIQLSAMKTPGAITKSWQQLVSKEPTLIGGLSPITEAVERSNGTIYRLKVGPFGNKQEAKVLCSKLRKVNVPCIVSQYAENAKYLPTN
jgi:cell division protein FtsN